jgi:hypothetical protein
MLIDMYKETATPLIDRNFYVQCHGGDKDASLSCLYIKCSGSSHAHEPDAEGRFKETS